MGIRYLVTVATPLVGVPCCSLTIARMWQTGHPQGASLLLSQYPRCITRSNLLPFDEAVEGEMLHVLWFSAGQDELRHPLADDGREFESMSAEASRAVEPFVC